MMQDQWTSACRLPPSWRRLPILWKMSTVAAWLTGRWHRALAERCRLPWQPPLEPEEFRQRPSWWASKRSGTLSASILLRQALPTQISRRASTCCITCGPRRTALVRISRISLQDSGGVAGMPTVRETATAVPALPARASTGSRYRRGVPFGDAPSGDRYGSALGGRPA